MDWYDVVESNAPILQGDFVDECPIAVPRAPLKKGRVPFEATEYNIVVMSQSCDLVQKKLELVLVCPVFPLEEICEKDKRFKDDKIREALRQGNLPGNHLLNKCEIEGFGKGYSLVDFRLVYSVEYEFLCKFCGKSEKRLRLMPPYREHLSQAFARFFMRVGLPVDIPKEYWKNGVLC